MARTSTTFEFDTQEAFAAAGDDATRDLELAEDADDSLRNDAAGADVDGGAEPGPMTAGEAAERAVTLFGASGFAFSTRNGWRLVGSCRARHRWLAVYGMGASWQAAFAEAERGDVMSWER